MDIIELLKWLNQWKQEKNRHSNGSIPQVVTKGYLFKGKGCLVPIIFSITLILFIILASVMDEHLGIKFEETLLILLGVVFMVAGLFISLAGKEFIKVDGKRVEIDLDNRFFFIKMKILGKASIFIGIAITIYGLIKKL